MEQNFSIAQAARDLSALLTQKEPTQDRGVLRERVLDTMLKTGFERARFYERCGDPAREDTSILVLVGELPAPDTSNVGFPVDVDDSVLGYATAVEGVHLGSGPPKGDPEWYERFEMDGRQWIDVALRAGNDEVGILAVDWRDRDRQVTDDDLAILSAVGMMIGSHLQLRPQRRLLEFRDELRKWADEAKESPEPAEMVVEGARIIGELINARLAVVFEHVWATNKLEKRCEIDIASAETSDSSPFLTGDESYVSGKCLTGAAWHEPRLRHIPVFSHLEHYKKKLVDQASKKRHAAYLGEPIHTCLYGVVGDSEPRYMLRFINRAQGEPVPFVGEKVLLDELLTELRSDLETSTAVWRTRNLERATRIAAETTEPARLVTQLADLLLQENVTEFVFLCHQVGSLHFSFVRESGVNLRELRLLADDEWEADQLYARLVNGSTVGAVEALKGTSKSRLARGLLAKDRDRVVNLPFKAGETVGVMLIPLMEGLDVHAGSLVAKLGAGRLSLLHTYARLIGDVVDSSIAHERAEGARQALGVLGHELASPLASLGSAAELGLSAAHESARDAHARVARGDSKGAIKTIEHIRLSSAAYLEKAHTSRRSVGGAMAMAPIVASETNGRLELQFREFNLGQLVLEAIAVVEQEYRVLHTVPNRTYDFSPARSILKLGDTVGDDQLLKHVLLNLLRNAAKYSMTPGGGSTKCVIDIKAEPQPQGKMDIVIVGNWGRGIPPELMDRIFDPWTRFDDDAVVARRGMGLGLYLARRIAYAHGGTVRCRKSDPTLSDPSRRARLDGHETEFELRLPRNHKEGAYSHQWRVGEPVLPPQRKAGSPLRGLTKAPIRKGGAAQ